MVEHLRSVLIVDDDPDLREALTEVLTLSGYDVSCAGDGFEALDYLRRNRRPCLILLDWNMPRCNGPQFREVQAKDPHLGRIPVVLFTAEPDPQAKRTQLGVADCLTKPTALDDLLTVVGRYCPAPCMA